MVAVMNRESSDVGTTPLGDDGLKGIYVVTGDTLAPSDRWMAEKYKQNSRVGKGTGRYRWAATATGTRCTLINGACVGRARGLRDSGAWTRIP